MEGWEHRDMANNVAQHSRRPTSTLVFYQPSAEILMPCTAGKARRCPCHIQDSSRVVEPYELLAVLLGLDRRMCGWAESLMPILPPELCMVG